MRCFNLLVPVMALAACVATLAQTPTYNRGRTPGEEEIRAWDISIGPEGKELPPGSGTAQEGATIYAQQCAYCHGPTGAEGPSLTGVANLWPYSFMSKRPPRPLLGGKGTLNTPNPVKTIGSFWPFATTIWDYVNRAMPPGREGSLSADEVYALTAVLLYWNGIIQESAVIDANTLPKIQMPNRNGFVPPRPEWKTPSGDRRPTP